MSAEKTMTELRKKLQRHPHFAAMVDEIEATDHDDMDQEGRYRLPYSSSPLRTGERWNMKKMLE